MRLYMKSIEDRIKKIEAALMICARKLFVSDEDNFVSSFVGEDRKEAFKKEGGGYDHIAAISSTAAEDWKDYK